MRLWLSKRALLVKKKKKRKTIPRSCALMPLNDALLSHCLIHQSGLKAFSPLVTYSQAVYFLTFPGKIYDNQTPKYFACSWHGCPSFICTFYPNGTRHAYCQQI